MADIHIERLTGAALRDRLGALAELRIAVFRDFPYLYAGSAAYEEQYLRTYAEARDSVIVAARDGDRVVGGATGLPLENEPDAVTAPFRERGLDVGRIFYFGESVLLPQYRGRGIGVAFFAQREDFARALGRFTHACFCAVQRPPDHPLRPADYVPLDAFWRRRGYETVPGLTVEFSWQDIDRPAETAKTMQFWMKAL